MTLLADAARERLLQLGELLRTASTRERDAAGLALLAMGVCMAANTAEDRARRTQRRP